MNNTLSRLDRELKDIESAGKATLDLLEKISSLPRRRNMKSSLPIIKKEQEKLSSINQSLTGTLLTPDEAMKQQ